MISHIKNFLTFIFVTTSKGIYSIFLVLSKGMFFYFYQLFSVVEKIFKFSFLDKVKNFFKRLQSTPFSSIVVIVIFISSVLFYKYLYPSNEKLIHVSDNYDIGEVESKSDSDVITKEDKIIYNLYDLYSRYNINDIDFDKLNDINSSIVAWLIVDSTNINYPIVQGTDNDYYLYHDINNDYSIGGWTFMDYRNDSHMDNKNTIIYGHNLFNNTAFGSLSKVFSEKWFKSSNHRILLLTRENKYTFEVFSLYYKDAESYYLKTMFNDDDYKKFVDNLKSRSIYDFGVDISGEDKMITLSTCSDDNRGRKVVHAKLINVE